MNQIAKESSTFYRLFLRNERRPCGRHGSYVIGILASLVSLPICLFPSSALTEDDFLPYQQFVKYNNDSISLALNNVRAGDAVQLMHSTTGIMITLPTSTQSRTITLSVVRARMDQAIESLLTALELNNSFIVYDPDGRLTGVIALEKGVPQPRSDSLPSDEQKQKAEFQKLTAPEREALMREFRLWSKLSAEDRESIHARLKTIPASQERDELIKEYVRLVLGSPEPDPEANE